MKKIIFCLVMALSLTATKAVFAQNGNSGQMQQIQRQYLKDSVHLSDAMVDSVMAVRREYQPKMREIFRDSLSDADKKSKMQSLRTGMEARLKTIGLTDDQIKMIREHDQRMREQMRSRNNS